MIYAGGGHGGYGYDEQLSAAFFKGQTADSIMGNLSISLLWSDVDTKPALPSYILNVMGGKWALKFLFNYCFYFDTPFCQQLFKNHQVRI